MPMTGTQNGERVAKFGFTRAELLVCLGAVTFLFAVSLPMLAVLPSREHRALCANNLRQAGVAFHTWANDHADNLPWVVLASQGGTRGNAVAAAHWQILSGYLPTPSLLACPASPRKPVAQFGVLRDANISYLVGSDSDLTQPSTIVSGDRDIEGGTDATCGFVGDALVQSFDGQFGMPFTYRASWSKTNHYSQGNLLTADGAVLATDGLGLLRALSRSTDSGNNSHALIPR